MKTFIIIFLILMYIMTGVLLAVIFHGEYFWYRVLIIYPFTFAMIGAIKMILKYKEPIKIEI